MAHTRSESDASTGASSSVTKIDPRAPRFGQTVTMSVLLLGIGLREPLLILAIAVILDAAILSDWRVNLYGFIWQHVVIPVIGKPPAMEPAAPHRFAKLIGATMSTVAVVMLFGAPVVGLDELVIVGYGVALVHAAAAAIGGLGDYCIGCRMYKQVGYFRRLGVL